MGQIGYVVAVCTSPKKGMRKKNKGRGLLVVDHGLAEDAHAGPWHRQVSLLALESIQKMRDAGLDVHPGNFAENITTVGLDLASLPLGSRITIGAQAEGVVTQIGKECHTRCAIYHQAGDCVMPREGIFIKVARGGEIRVGDRIKIGPARDLIPVVSVVGWSGSGKTTFLEQLVAVLKEQGIRVGVIKHHHGDLALDVPGTDTWRLKRAGAVCTVIAGNNQVGLVLDAEGGMGPHAIVAMLPELDLILTEGYKGGPYPQLEVRRAGAGADKPAARSELLVAVVGEPSLGQAGVPCFKPDDARGVANFLQQKYLTPEVNIVE